MLTVILKFLFGCLIVALMLIGAFVTVCAPMAIWDASPWWGGGALIAVLGGGTIYYWLAAARRRRRENKAVEASPSPDAPRDEASTRVRVLWDDARRALRASHLRGRGNVLYAQPWGVMLGASGAGKTRAVAGSRLTTELGVGKNDARCSVHFLRDLALIDPQGEKFVAGEETANPDHEDLSCLLTLLAAARSREPLNYIVLTVGADSLLDEHADDLQSYGRQLSAQIDAIYRRFGCRIPLYLLVTKLDLVYGMRELARALPDDVLTQAMGAVNTAALAADGFAEETFADLTRRLQTLRLQLAFSVKGDAAAISAAPAGFAQLLPGLRAVLRGAFAPNPYRQPLTLRGLFFGAGCAEGTPEPLKLTELGLPAPSPAPDADWDKNAARLTMFLSDFFGKVLPADRDYYRPLPEFARWRVLRANLGVLAILCFAFAAALGMTAAFLQQYALLKKHGQDTLAVLPDYPPAQIRQLPSGAEMAGVLYQLNEASRYWQNLSAENRGAWWTRWFGMNGLSRYERRAAADFTRQFRQYVINVLDLRITRDQPLNRLDGADFAPRFGAFYEYLVRRVNLSRQVAAGNLSANTLARYPAPSAGIWRAVGAALSPDAGELFHDLYAQYYLAWRDRGLAAEETQALSRELVGLLRSGWRSLDWLTPWVNQLDTLTDVRLSDFWRGATDGDAEVYLPRGYTAAGSKELVAFVRQIDDALFAAEMDDLERQALRADMRERAERAFRAYKQQAYAAWLRFAAQMPAGRGYIATEEEMKYLAGLSAALNGPYEHFLDRLLTDVLQISGNDIAQLPQWMRLILAYRQYRVNSLTAKFIGASTSYANTALNYAAQLKSFVQRVPAPLAAPQMAVNPSAAFGAYCQGLLRSGPPPGNLSRELAYAKVATLFGGKALPTATLPNQADAMNSLKQAVDQFAAFAQALNRSNATAEEQIIWHCARGPLDLVVAYNLYEAAQVAAKSWNDAVLAGLSAVPPTNVPQELFDQKNGRVWQWLKEVGETFFAGSAAQNFQPKTVSGYTLPLHYDQLSAALINGAKGGWSMKPQYNLNVTALPVDVNERAVTLPLGVTLTLYAAEGPQTLRNLNYPASRQFIWKPAEDGRVELRVEFPTFALIKTYDGPFGFARFCGEFTDGTRVFQPEEFPEAAAQLREMCVNYLRVSYKFEPAQLEAIVRLNNLVEVNAPGQIAPNFDEWQNEFRAARSAANATANAAAKKDAPSPESPAAVVAVATKRNENLSPLDEEISPLAAGDAEFVNAVEWRERGNAGGKPRHGEPRRGEPRRDEPRRGTPRDWLPDAEEWLMPPYDTAVSVEVIKNELPFKDELQFTAPPRGAARGTAVQVDLREESDEPPSADARLKNKNDSRPTSSALWYSATVLNGR
ncbi:type VI secretion system protein ImpL [Planctomycetales bacterium]|nr:type VI secretion system protein ImpL [Planctomycetales bacterium]